jgi:hypothetical protein
MDETTPTNRERQELGHEPQDDWPRIHGAVLAAAVFWLATLLVWGAYVGKVASHGAH